MRDLTWTEKELVEKSTEALFLSATLDMKELPPVMIEQAKASIVAAMLIRDRRMRDLEKEAKEKEARAVRAEEKRGLLAAIGGALPTDLGVVTVEENQFTGPFLKGKDFSIELEAGLVYGRLYTKSDNAKLVVFVNGEKRRFPRKADGTFSLDRAAEFIRENLKAKASRIESTNRKEAQLNRFREITKPYRKHELYETNANFRILDNEMETVTLQISRCSNIEDQYLVQRVIVRKRIVNPEELAAILVAEVDEVARG